MTAASRVDGQVNSIATAAAARLNAKPDGPEAE